MGDKDEQNTGPKDGPEKPTSDQNEVQSSEEAQTELAPTSENIPVPAEPASDETSSVHTTPRSTAPAQLRMELIPQLVDDIPPALNGDMSEEERTMAINKMINFPVPFPAMPIPTSNATAIRVTAGEMEVTEMKVKIICQEKNILALRMELKAAELQVEARLKVDEKKTRLIELLDNKLASVEKRNIKLMDMVEQMLKDKDGNSTRLRDATKNMQDLTQRLVESERIKSELLRMNAELRKMLENIESKGTQIAKLAKEKVPKYKDEKDQMEQKLSDMESAEATRCTLAAAGRQPSEPASAAASEELWSKINELQLQISTALQSINSSSSSCLQQTLDDASKASEALKLSVEEARVKMGEDLSALATENDQLRALVEDFDVTRKAMKKNEEKNRDQLVEQRNCVTAKDKEINELKEELQRLKAAIGTLIGAK